MQKRNQLKRTYIESWKEKGVYQIRNTANQRILVAGSLNLTAARNRFSFGIERVHHTNEALMEDFRQYGADKFVFEVLEEIKKNEDQTHDYAFELETMLKKWIEKLSPFGEKGYNSPPRKL